MEVKSQTFEVNIEADNNDTTKHTSDDKPRPYSCTVCHKRFTTKGSLTSHRALHTGENWYSCTQCEKRLPTQSKLTEHMNIHTGKYKCTECGKCCVSRGELAVHRRSHTGEKPFECNVCGQRFAHKSNLVAHVGIHSERNRLNVPFVISDLDCQLAFFVTAKFTVETSYLNVLFVTNDLH